MSEPSTGEACGSGEAPECLKFLVLHGLGMDKRGYVDVDKWGTTTLAQYNEFIQAWAHKVGGLCCDAGIVCSCWGLAVFAFLLGARDEAHGCFVAMD